MKCSKYKMQIHYIKSGKYRIDHVMYILWTGHCQFDDLEQLLSIMQNCAAHQDVFLLQPLYLYIYIIAIAIDQRGFCTTLKVQRSFIVQCRLQLSHHNREMQNVGNCCSTFNRHCVPKSVLLMTNQFTNFHKNLWNTLHLCFSQFLNRHWLVYNFCNGISG